MATFELKPGFYQTRVHAWMLECFGPAIAADMYERNARFLEEALELVQSLGFTREDVLRLVEYTYARPPGEPPQEVGGVAVTLATLCTAAKIDMAEAGQAELARITDPDTMARIRAKQASKPVGVRSPLPGESQ